ncbi:MAG: DegT/DnrJ/EryC1/StrS family aminotransferase, partial [Myxococcota bacterium]
MSEEGFRREGIGSRLPLDGAALFGRGRGGVRWPGTNAIGFETGRAAIGWLSDALGLGPGDRALLPAYLCESVVAPFRSRGVAVDFYRVDARLAPDAADARARLTPQTRILMVIHYFGFPLPQAQLAPMPHAPGLVRLEDWVQGPLTAGALAVDRGFGEYRVLAWHKVLPVPDSGLLLRRADVPPPPRCPPLRAPRAAFFGRRLLAKFLKAVAVRIAGGAPSALYRPLFDAAERAAGAGVPVRMSRLSRRILAGADLAGVTRRRRDNFL